MNKKDQLQSLLIKSSSRLMNDDIDNIKAYEAAFQDDISTVFPDKAWWEVCKCDIFGLFFFDRLEPYQVIKEIIDSIQPEFLTEQSINTKYVGINYEYTYIEHELPESVFRALELGTISDKQVVDTVKSVLKDKGIKYKQVKIEKYEVHIIISLDDYDMSFDESIENEIDNRLNGLIGNKNLNESLSSIADSINEFILDGDEEEYLELNHLDIIPLEVTKILKSLGFNESSGYSHSYKDKVTHIEITYYDDDFSTVVRLIINPETLEMNLHTTGNTED